LNAVSSKHSWAVLVVTNNSVGTGHNTSGTGTSVEEGEVVQHALSSGEWLVDNNRLPDQISLNKKQKISEKSEQNVFNSKKNEINTANKLVPLKSFRNKLANLSVTTLFAVLYNSHLILFLNRFL
jgi:hypothetical protein